MIKTIIFDFDGTLVDSLKDITITLNTVMKNNDLPEMSTKGLFLSLVEPILDGMIITVFKDIFS